MKLSNFSFSAFATSVAALGGLAIAGYQAFHNTGTAPKEPTTVEVRVALDKDGNPVVTPAPQTQTAAVANQGQEQAPAAQPVAASQEISAPALLANIKQAIAIIPASFTEQGAAQHRSSTQVVDASAEAAAAVDDLDQAIRIQDAKKVSAATKRTSRAVSKLQTSYSVSPGRTEKATRALRSVDSNWSTYTARYALGKPKGKAKPTNKEVKKLKRDLRKLEQRVAALEKKNAKNKALQRELARTRAELAYYDDFSEENYNYERYQALLISINGVYGSFDALAETTKEYYPDEYDSFQQLYTGDDLADAYWDGYYDGYYNDAEWGWYQEPFAVPETVQLAPEPSITVVQNVTINQTITIQQINEIAASARQELKAAPVEAMPAAAPPPLPAQTVRSSAELIELSSTLAAASKAAEQPAAEGQQSAPAAEAPAAPADEQAPKSDAAAPAQPEQPATPVEQPAPDQATKGDPAAPAPAPAAPAEQPAAEPAPAPAPAEQQAAPAEQPAAEPAPAPAPAEQEAAPAEQPAAEPAPAPAPAEQPAAPAEQPAAEPAPAPAPAEQQAAPAEQPAAEPAPAPAPAPAEQQAAPAEQPAAEPAPAPAEKQAAPGEAAPAAEVPADAAAGQAGDGKACAEGEECPPPQ